MEPPVPLDDQIAELEDERARRIRAASWQRARKSFSERWYGIGLRRLDAAIATLKALRDEPLA